VSRKEGYGWCLRRPALTRQKRMSPQHRERQRNQDHRSYGDACARSHTPCRFGAGTTDQTLKLEHVRNGRAAMSASVLASACYGYLERCTSPVTGPLPAGRRPTDRSFGSSTKASARLVGGQMTVQRLGGPTAAWAPDASPRARSRAPVAPAPSSPLSPSGTRARRRRKASARSYSRSGPGTALWERARPSAEDPRQPLRHRRLCDRRWA